MRVSFFSIILISSLLTQRASASAELRNECLLVDNLPSHKQCTGQFFIRSSDESFDEEFLLSVNDPIEYFHFQSRYFLLADSTKTRSLFVRLPILGRIKDQFIDNDPYSDSLLFTVSVAGIGYVHRWNFVELGVDSSLIYLKQRYAPNYVHSKIPRETRKNALYDFAGYGGLTEVSISFFLPFHVSFIYSTLRIDMEDQGSWYQDLEHSFESKWSMFQNTNIKTGLSGRYFLRANGLRHDRDVDIFETARFGLFLEFL